MYRVSVIMIDDGGDSEQWMEFINDEIAYKNQQEDATRFLYYSCADKCRRATQYDIDNGAVRPHRFIVTIEQFVADPDNRNASWIWETCFSPVQSHINELVIL